MNKFKVIRKYIAEGNTKEAISELMEIQSIYSDEVLLLSSRFSFYWSKLNKGVISNEVEHLEFNRITLQLINLLNKIETEVGLATIGKSQLNSNDNSGFKITNLLKPKLKVDENSKKGIPIDLQSGEEIFNVVILSSNVELMEHVLYKDSEIEILNKFIELLNTLRLDYDKAIRGAEDEKQRNSKEESFLTQKKKTYIEKFEKLLSQIDNNNLYVNAYRYELPYSRRVGNWIGRFAEISEWYAIAGIPTALVLGALRKPKRIKIEIKRKPVPNNV